ncbi:MAG: GtrA family protein [Eggerthellaceae bacterium]|nr:GtrA family protein [Eggerthellaceae bacterium]
MSKRTAKQFVRFSIVGTSTFFIDYGLLMLLSQVLGVEPVISSAISFTVSLVINYFASMKFVFTRREDISRRRQFGLFVLLSLIALLVNTAIVWIGMGIFENTPLNLTIVKIVATMMVTLWNFFSRRRWLDAEGRRQMKGQSANLRKAIRLRWLKWKKRRRR